MAKSLIVGFIFTLFLSHTATAQITDEEERHQLGLLGGLTAFDTYRIELSYHYFVNKHFGMGGSVGFFKQWNATYGYPGSSYDTPPWKEWSIDAEYEKVFSFYLLPSIQLHTPTLFRIKEYTFNATVEPGVMIRIPYEQVYVTRYNNIDTEYKRISSDKGSWYAWHLKASLNFNQENHTISAGYSISDFDVYSYRRNMSFEGIPFSKFYPNKRRFSHMLFVSFGYRF